MEEGNGDMLAQKKQAVRQYSGNRGSKRRKKNILLRMLANRMVGILLLASVVCFVLTVYVGAYARVTEEGYHKAELLAQLKELRVENEKLSVSVDNLRQPGRVAAFAQENGMLVGDKMVYLKPQTDSHLAQNAQD